MRNKHNFLGNYCCHYRNILVANMIGNSLYFKRFLIRAKVKKCNDATVTSFALKIISGPPLTLAKRILHHQAPYNTSECAT